MKSLTPAFATLAFAALISGCASTVSWRDHHTSSVLENQRELLARIKVRLHGVDLNDCTACLSAQTRMEDKCSKIDSSGMVYQKVTRPYAWLKTLECRLEGGAVVRRDFVFPYYAADTQNLDTVHYLGEINIDLEGDVGTSVVITDKLEQTLTDLHTLGKRALPLKIHRALLKRQENIKVIVRRVTL